MYERIAHDLGDCVEDVRLLHSISQLVIEDNRIVEKAIQNKFGAAIKVLTPHQLAAIALGTKGYEAMLFDLQGCDLILDEDPYVFGYGSVHCSENGGSNESYRLPDTRWYCHHAIGARTSYSSDIGRPGKCAVCGIAGGCIRLIQSPYCS